jgi:hypothetical protein
MSDVVLDPNLMRFQLQKVVAYRQLCQAVRKSGRENVTFALIFLVFAFFTWPNNVFSLIILSILIGGELFVGFAKWLFPSAAGFLLDGLVLLIFAAYDLFLVYLQFQLRGRPQWLYVGLAAYMFYLAIGRFKTYRQFSKLFAERPSAEHLAWFHELIYEIRSAHPEADELALDLPTRPHWKAKLLGTTVFFVAVRSSAVFVAGPNDFEILRENTDRGTGVRKAFLQIYGQPYPEFEIDDATWANYKKWRVEYPAN